MKFDWIPFYTSLAMTLLSYKNRRMDLLERLYSVYQNIHMKFPKMEKDDEIIDIDPFSVYSLFNKGIKDETRLLIIQEINNAFHLNSSVPTNFDGIPVANNLSATFFYFKDQRGAQDIQHLWDLFEEALTLAEHSTTVTQQQFIEKYDQVIKQKGIKWNITMGLYWIRPYSFLSLDGPNRTFLIQPDNMTDEFCAKWGKFTTIPDGAAYLQLCQECSSVMQSKPYHSFPELSLEAWLRNRAEQKEAKPVKESGDTMMKTGYCKWMGPLVRALKDLGGRATPQEACNKIVENEQVAEAVLNEKVGKNNINKFSNEVAWARHCLVFNGYIDNTEHGIWKLTEAGQTVDMTAELASELIRKMNAAYQERRKHDDLSSEDNKILDITEYDEDILPVYEAEDFLQDVYMDEKKYEQILHVLRRKKNIILQGAPGVGKTYIAKRLAYSVMGYKDDSKISMVQFHQSYSYEDFIMGFRPSESGFVLKKGSFYSFCKQADTDREHDYFFIIDEINRGNLSKIFGEILMLLEADKRDTPVQVLYSDELFSIPENVYLIGMMNTADRSIAILDYALRRRFAFVEIQPAFSQDAFQQYIQTMNCEVLTNVIQCLIHLNQEITDDDSLGKGFCIGHSYFCNITGNVSELEEIITYEIIPLLSEYWFDEPEKIDYWTNQLRSALT